MGRVIAVANQKGGVGKTTTSINLSACLAEKGKKVLLVDMDSQGNTTSGLGLEKNELDKTIYEVLRDEIPVEDSIVEIDNCFGNLFLIPSNRNLAGAEIELITSENMQYILKRKLAPIKDNYDFIILDCPPALGMLTVNALAAADNVLIPVQAAYLPAKGLEQLLETISKVKRQINPKLKIEGILLTMVDSRTNYSKDISNLIRESYGGKLKVYKSDIPRSVRAEEISAEGHSIFKHDPKGKVAEAYKILTKEVMDHAEKRRKHQLEGIR